LKLWNLIMRQREYEGQLLQGRPIKIDFFQVVPLTLKQLFDYGEEECHKLLSYFFFDIDDLELGDRKEFQDISKFIIFSLVLNQEKNFQSEILKGLNLFTDVKFEFKDGAFLYKDKYIINEERWEKLKHVLSWQYKLKYNPKSLKYNPKNKRAREMERKIEATRKEVQKIKSKKKDDVALTDLISGLCARHPTINLFNVWDLTYYQFIDQLQRLQIVDEYDFSLKSILAGADAKKINVKHWTIKL